MDWLTLAACVGACVAAGSTGMFFTPGEWYRSLDKPWWTPPDWLFPVAWTILYASMSVAAARVAGEPGGGQAVAFWALQIALNTLWSPIFFGLRRLGAAIVVIVGLWGAVAACILLFARIDLIAALLMAPYLVWVSYVAALNVSVWRRNPQVTPLPLNESPA
jgi:tryptophan-rich sensory protein